MEIFSFKALLDCIKRTYLILFKKDKYSTRKDSAIEWIKFFWYETDKDRIFPTCLIYKKDLNELTTENTRLKMKLHNFLIIRDSSNRGQIMNNKKHVSTVINLIRENG